MQSTSSLFDPFLDMWLWGARDIGEAANVRNKDGSVNEKKATRLIVQQVIPAEKVRGRWRSTRRKIYGIPGPGAA
jgi:hypothetical protein